MILEVVSSDGIEHVGIWDRLPRRLALAGEQQLQPAMELGGFLGGLQSFQNTVSVETDGAPYENGEDVSKMGPIEKDKENQK